MRHECRRLAQAGLDDVRVEAIKQQQRRMTKMNKIMLAIVLAIATLAAVPASAGPYCQEDLGYGRTSSFGCGG
jgi:pyruvate formate-lyase activating enzyme-like uncharacterized protein